MRKELKNKIYVSGHITKSKINSAFQLKYAKKEALVIIKKMYYNPNVICLSRKRVKIEKAIEIESKQQDRYKI